MVPALEYVLEPTYSAHNVREEREGQVYCLEDRQETQLAVLETARRGFYSKENNRKREQKELLTRQDMESNNNPSTTATSNRTY